MSLQDPEILRALVARPDAVVCSIDADGLVELEHGGETILGWSPGEFVGRPLAALVHPVDRLAAERAWCVPVADGARVEIENRFRSKDSSYRWFRWACIRRDSVWFCAGQDVSEAKATEEALERSRALVAGFQDGVISLELDGRVIDVNERYCQITGFTREEILLWSPPFPTWPEEYRTTDMERFARNNAEANVLQRTEREVTYQRKDGSRFPAVLVVSPVRDPAGVVGGTVGVLRDVTEQRRRDAIRADEQRLVARSETRLREAQVTAQIGNWTWAADVDRLTPSSVLLSAFSLPADSALTLDEYFAIVHEEDRARARTFWSEAIRERRAFATDYRVCLPEVGDVWLDVRGRPELDASGAFVGFNGTAQNITERKLSEQKAHFQAGLVDQVDIAVVATDRAGIVTNWNMAAERLYGWTAEDAIGQDAESLAVPADGRHADEVMAEVRSKGRWDGEIRLKRKDGSTFPALATNAIIRDERGEAVGLVGVAVDITARNLEHEQLLQAERFMAAVTDNMAEGLLTVDREGLVTHMNPEAERLLGWTTEELLGRPMHEVLHHTHPDGSPHPVEDCPLTAVRTGGASARVEEDVFIHRDGTPVPITYTGSPLSTDEGVTGAVIVFSDITARQIENLRLLREIDELVEVSRIRDALSEGRFVLFAQPIVDVSDGRTISHELLVRMRHEGTLLAPGEFLPTAEKHGLIKDIDHWVIGEAARLAAEGGMVQVNVSAMSFADLSLPDTFAEAFSRWGTDPANVVVELTETALVETEMAEEVVARLTALGMQMSLDDFGTGYAGFTHLKRLPVFQLKIDREFVHDLVSNPASRHVVEAVIALARGFGRKTVAEGVEDQPTLDLLRELGVDYVQGFLLGRPAPVDEVVLALAAN